MSLGGSLKSRTEETAFTNAYTNQNVLSIAAAGNDGNIPQQLPGGVQLGRSRWRRSTRRTSAASFSQYNSDVEIAAPGVAVLSTVPDGHRQCRPHRSRRQRLRRREAMDGSPQARPPGSKAMVNCGIGDATCMRCRWRQGLPDPARHVTILDKVLNCQAGGGVAAIIYNNDDGCAATARSNGVATTIPSVGITADRLVRAARPAATSTTGSVAVAASSNYA